jgi:hypothetical protein
MSSDVVLGDVSAPPGLDGYDLVGALASESTTDSPRYTAVLQHDVFLNSSSYR